jgi:hypothetical protein
MVGVLGGFMMLCIGLEAWDYSAELEQGKTTPYAIIAGILNSIACSLWIAMDRKRRGQEPGSLRWAGLFLGPAAVCVQILLDYKGRALFLLPIVVGVFLAIVFLPYVAVLAIHRFWS